MNKKIFTNDRLFVSLVGPRGSGKTRLILAMLASPTTFHPTPQKTYFFAKNFIHHSKKWLKHCTWGLSHVSIWKWPRRMKTVHCSSMILAKESTRKKNLLRSSLLEAIKKIHCNIIKHNLFHESKWSLKNDLITTHVDLFEIPRDFQRFDRCGTQVNKSHFIRDRYQKATSAPLGLFLIDFDPTTIESLRLFSNITGLGPTILNLVSSLAKATALSNKKEKCACTDGLGK